MQNYLEYLINSILDIFYCSGYRALDPEFGQNRIYITGQDSRMLFQANIARICRTILSLKHLCTKTDSSYFFQAVYVKEEGGVKEESTTEEDPLEVEESLLKNEGMEEYILVKEDNTSVKEEHFDEL